MNFNKLTVKAQEAIAEAQNLARGAGNPEVTPEHLLLALLRQEGGIVTPILNKLGLSPATIEAEVASDHRTSALRRQHPRDVGELRVLEYRDGRRRRPNRSGPQGPR